MRKIELFGFGGVNSALDPRLIPDTAAQDCLNVRVENGQILPRFGFRLLRAAQSGFSAVLGFDYLQGYSSTTEVEEYVSFETVSSNTRAYSNAVDGSSKTEIKNGTNSVNLNASEWVAMVFDGDAYFINPNDSSPLYRHAIGDATSLTAVAIPSAPSVAATYAVTYGGGSTPYSQISFAGIDPATEIAYTGTAHSTDSALNSDNTLNIGHTTSKGAASFEVDLNGSSGGILDFTYNDRFAMSLACLVSNFNIDPASIQIQFTNNDGTPHVLIPSDIKVVNGTVRPPGTSGNAYAVYFAWSDKDRTLFDNVRKIKISYTVTSTNSTASNNVLVVSKPFIGGVDLTGPTDRSHDTPGIHLFYTYYFSTPQFESGVSPELFVPNTAIQGSSPLAGLPPLGTQITLTMTVSGDSNVDDFRIYLQDTNGTFHRLGTQADSGTTFIHRITYVEALRLTEYQPTPFAFADVTAAFPYKGSVVWLYKGGSEDVRFSRVGDALRQASTDDPQDDQARGATFTLADNFSDEPVGGAQTGDAVMIAGKYGVYAMFGDFPAQMTPPRKVSGSYGVAGKYAFCRWKDDNGQPGMAYVSRDGQVFFAIPGGFAAQETGDNIILSGPIRTGALSLKTFLLDGQSALSLTDFSTAQIFADDQQEALWIVMGKRALVLRRPDASGVRHWEPYEFNTGGSTVSIRYCSGSTKRRVRWMRSDGKFDEAEYNSSTNAFITGSNKDGGNAIQSLYWRSKTLVGPIEWCCVAKAYRSDLANTPTMTIYSTRTPSGESTTWASGDVEAFFSVETNGSEHSIKIAIGENDSPYSRLECLMKPGGNRLDL